MIRDSCAEMNGLPGRINVKTFDFLNVWNHPTPLSLVLPIDSFAQRGSDAIKRIEVFVPTLG